MCPVDKIENFLRGKPRGTPLRCHLGWVNCSRETHSTGGQHLCGSPDVGKSEGSSYRRQCAGASAGEGVYPVGSFLTLWLHLPSCCSCCPLLTPEPSFFSLPTQAEGHRLSRNPPGPAAPHRNCPGTQPQALSNHQVAGVQTAVVGLPRADGGSLANKSAFSICTFHL